MVRNNLDFSKKCGTFGCQLHDGHPGLHVIPEDGGRREHSVAALCEVELAAAHFGVASLSPADVVAGWLA